MKRWFLLVLTILTTLSVVCAQESEEKILGMSISSLLVVLPLLMIVLGMLFFLALYLRDHYGDVLDFFKGRMKRRRKGERIKKVINYPKEVQALQKQLPTLEPEEGAHRLSGLANKFFAEKFNIDYEFTHGELEKELKVEKESWASFPKKLSDLRYSGEPLSRKELNALVKEFWDIVKYEKIKRLTPTIVEKLRKRRLTFEIGLLKNLRRYLEKAKPEEKEKLTSTDVMRYFIKRQKENLSGLFKIFKKVQTDTSAEMKTQLETVGKVKDYFSDKLVEKQINDTLNLIEEAQEQITKGKIDQAKKTYRQAYHRYYKLPIEEQVPIIVELQNIQKKINQYKPPKPKVTIIGRIKERLEKRLTQQRINKVINLIEEAQQQITKGKTDQAKKTYQQAYKLYYHLPIEKQVPVITELQNIQKKINQYKPPKPREKAIKEIKRIEQKLTEQGVTKIDELLAGAQQQITTELHDIQEKIKKYPGIAKETIIDPVKEYFEKRLTQQRINKVKDLIEEAQEQITKGKIDQAKKTYRQAYHRYYKLPIEEQVPIIVELQKIQKRIHKYKKPPKIAQETVIDQVKEYFEKRLTGQKINKVNSLIEEAQEQITKGKINEAKKTCQQAYRLYYHLPIEEQAPALFQLRQIQERVKESEKDIERLEIEELAKDLGKLKSERDIYVILDKSDIHKKLNFLTKYVQKVEKQGVHSLKAGKVHLKEKLKDFIETAEKKEGKKLTPKEKKFLTRIKEVGSFYTRKEEALEKALKQTQKQIFSKLHNITKQIKIGLHPKTKKKIIKQIPRQIVKPELKPSTPPLPEKKETRALGEIEKLLLSLKKRRKERFYILRPAGKEFLDKIEATINTIKESEQKGIRALKHYEEEFIHSLSLLMGKKEEKVIPHTEEEERMLEFLEHMKEEEMIHIEEQKLQREKERLKTKPLIETSKVKMDIKRLKNLEKEEEKIMRRLQKAPKKYPMPEKRIRRKRLEKYNWEITADEVRKKKTKEMHDLTKEEERILSKLNNLEKGFNS